MTCVERMLIAVLLTHVCIGCGGAPAADPNDSHERTFPIINGSPVIGDFAVVALGESGMRSRSSFSCSGTLVSRHVVVTAGHCLAFKGKLLAPQAVFFGNDLDAGGDVRTVKNWFTVPSYEPKYTVDRRIKDDLGVVILDQAAPREVASYALAKQPPSVGQYARFAGFGCRESSGRCGPFGEKYGVVAPIAAVSEHDFDYGIATCTGDSGGPAFVTENGVEVLSGITSSGDFACAEYGVATRVDAFLPWLERMIVAADPSPSTGAGSTQLADGQPCALDSDCASQVCEGLCRPLCNPTQLTACADGFKCEWDGRGAYACMASLTVSGGCSVGNNKEGRTGTRAWLWLALGACLALLRKHCRKKRRHGPRRWLHS